MKKMLFIFLLFFFFIIFSPFQQVYAALTAQQILDKIDQNYTYQNMTAVSTMIIKTPRATRTLTAKSYSTNRKTSYSEYLSPPRDKGTKMLKINDELWTYSPQADRIIKIAGHMLRQSMMGSDLSYEDFMEVDKLSDFYQAEIIKEEKIDNRECYILELTASKDGLAYPKRKIWVDKERFLPLREERYATSGKLLKTTQILEVFQVQNRWYPKHMVFKDVLKTGDGTEFIINSIEFNTKTPQYLFTKAALKESSL